MVVSKRIVFGGVLFFMGDILFVSCRRYGMRRQSRSLGIQQRHCIKEYTRGLACTMGCVGRFISSILGLYTHFWL